MRATPRRKLGPVSPTAPATAGTVVNHGTLAAYKGARCRCQSCKDANARYQAQYTRELAYGRELTVDPARVREHLEPLVERGMTAGRAARVAGVSRATVGRILGRHGNAQRVSAEIAEALMALGAEHLPTPRSVSALGTRRRIRALHAVGYSRQEIADASGVPATTISRALNPKTRTVGGAVARAITEAFDRADPAGPRHADPILARRAARIQREARAAQWATPTAWSDPDNPQERRIHREDA